MRIALIALAAVALAGCGSSHSVSATQQSNNQSIQQSGGGQSGSNQSSSSTQSSGSVSQQSSSAGGQTLTTFTGTGDATISVDVGGASRLLWSNTQGERFTARSDDGSVAVDSSAGSGEVKLPPGTHRLHVTGRLWTVLVRPS